MNGQQTLVLMLTIKDRLRRVYDTETGMLSSLLNILCICRDFIDECRLGAPLGLWTKSRLHWIYSSMWAALRKGILYVASSEEKRILRIEREKERIKKINSDPLVSIIIPTYNRADLLLNRSLPSVLSQTHRNIEVIIVGDHCTDNTETLLKEQKDPRIKFINLPERGHYPKEPILRWFVAGVIPINVGLLECKGKWIANLDDDDEFSSNHIELLLNFALEQNLEMVYGIVEYEQTNGASMLIGRPLLRRGAISRCSTLYKGYLKYFQYDINSWRLKEPADFNLWRRMKRAGVKIGFLNIVVGKHYNERTQLGR
jgi:hypothetical protein